MGLASGERSWRSYSALALSESKAAAFMRVSEVFQVTLALRTLRALRVAWTVLASTATPKGMVKTWMTPGTAMASAVLTESGRAPSMGDTSKVAYTMSGTTASMPNWACPLTLDITSLRPRLARPINLYCSGFLRSATVTAGSSAGTVANAAISP